MSRRKAKRSPRAAKIREAQPVETRQILARIAALQDVQKRNSPKTRAWQDASNELQPLFAEMARRQRRQLLRADAVIVCVARAIDSMQEPPDEVRVGEALQVASDIINDAVAALERSGGAS